jgi:3D-(3,5/4)-trihydroxycyclohexane-1,2-dione acylhydrolase (decyclizing)
MFGTIGDGRVRVDWAAHAASLGCLSESVSTLAELEDAFERARSADRTTVIAIETAPDRWTPGGAFWEVGVAEVAERPEIAEAHKRVREGKERQRVGW